MHSLNGLLVSGPECGSNVCQKAEEAQQATPRCTEAVSQMCIDWVVTSDYRREDKDPAKRLEKFRKSQQHTVVTSRRQPSRPTAMPAWHPSALMLPVGFPRALDSSTLIRREPRNSYVLHKMLRDEAHLPLGGQLYSSFVVITTTCCASCGPSNSLEADTMSL